MRNLQARTSVLQADAEDRIKEMALAQQQIDALAKQRDSAIEANKGGSFLQRLGRNAKWLLIGAVGGFHSDTRSTLKRRTPCTAFYWW
jgi:hypothetical protein